MTRVLLMSTAANGLTRRVAIALRAHGHQVRLSVVAGAADMRAAVVPEDHDVVICPYLTARIPEDVWRARPTVVIHPGPVGDRGPSSLDRAILDGEPVWGVTALSAVEEFDAGPVWATRTFPMPDPPARKSAVYNGPVADAAVACALEVADKVLDPAFRPVPADDLPRAVASARARPALRQAERAFSWDDPAEVIVRAVRASDGSPGVLADFGTGRAYAYDAVADGPYAGARPGTVVETCRGAVRVAARDSSVWIGHLRAVPGPAAGTSTAGSPATTLPAIKLPAADVLAGGGFGPVLDGVPESTAHPEPEITYRRDGDVGHLTFTFHNGAMSTRQCRDLFAAYRAAVADDTTVLVLRGGPEYFSNGIHLGVIEAAEHQALEAWRNIRAINRVCRAIVRTTTHVVVAAFTGNAGAGGVMLPLGADVVAARDGLVLDPHYATMGLTGSELHTYTLPRRVGAPAARRLTTACEPVGTAEALDIGLVDAVGPRAAGEFDAWLDELARAHVTTAAETLDLKRKTLEADMRVRPLGAYEIAELAEMARDMFDDRHEFAARRREFVFKRGGTRG